MVRSTTEQWSNSLNLGIIPQRINGIPLPMYVRPLEGRLFVGATCMAPTLEGYSRGTQLIVLGYYDHPSEPLG